MIKMVDMPRLVKRTGHHDEMVKLAGDLYAMLQRLLVDIQQDSVINSESSDWMKDGRSGTAWLNQKLATDTTAQHETCQLRPHGLPALTGKAGWPKDLRHANVLQN